MVCGVHVDWHPSCCPLASEVVAKEKDSCYYQESNLGHLTYTLYGQLAHS